MTYTSTSNPLYVAEVPQDLLRSLRATGRLGMTLLPGKQGKALMASGSHARDLTTDLEGLRSLYGGGIMVSLIEPQEYRDWGLGSLDEYSEALVRCDFELRSLAIPDMGVPGSHQAAQWRDLVLEVTSRLRAGEKVIVHCLGGLGRTGMLVGCVLVELGLEPEEAVRVTRAARPGAIQTSGQEREIRRYEEKTRR